MVEVSADLGSRVFAGLERDYRLCGAQRGADGIVRLLQLEAWPADADFPLPLVPLKKYLLPPKDLLWSEAPGAPTQDERPLAVLGVAPCDLSALAYLDRVFADDPGYRHRRQRLFVVGQPCTPTEECFCLAVDLPPVFDLFLAGERAAPGSAAGEELLARLGLTAVPRERLPAELWPQRGPELPEDLEERFATAVRRPLWREVGERCLSCGACSVVCPTCYCFAVHDEVDLHGGASRYRQWDNCFFASHGLVAGGHNFRPTHAERLRFRFEHKLLGFGELRGLPSCVGCGRCRRACPVENDIAEVARRLTGGDEP